MYTYEDRMKAVELYIKYDMSVATVIRELGYPSRGMLYNWYNEFKENSSLRGDDDTGYSRLKYSAEQRELAVKYYLEHGKSISRTIREIGYPKRTTMREWIHEDLPDNEKCCFTNKTLVILFSI